MLKKRIFRFLKWFLGIFLGLFFTISLVLYIYKDEICGLVIDEVNEYLKTDVNVSSVELTFWGSFPNLAVDFNDVFIRDTYEGSTNMDTLLFSDKVRLKFNPLDIWRENYTVKSIEVHPGVLKLKVNDAGLNNFDILKEKEDSLEESGFDLNLEVVEFEKFRFSYINHATDQEYKTRINTMSLEGAFDENVFTASANSDLQIISARSGNIALVSNKSATLNIGVNVNKDSNSVRIPASTIYVANLPFDFHGEVLDSSFTFKLKGKNIKIEDAANNLAIKEIDNVKKFSGKGTMLFDLSIDGDNDPVQPVSVHCEFGVNNATLTDPKTGITLNNLKLDGLYTNKGGPSKERLELKDIAFKTRGGPFRGNLEVTQFASPIFAGNADGSLNLAVVHSLFNIPKIQMLNGTVDLRSEFKVQGVPTPSGSMDYRVDKCEGNMEMNKVNVQLTDDKRVFQSINGKVYLRNDEAGLDDVTLRIGKSDFKVNGVFKDIVSYFSGDGDLNANIDIASKRINIDEDLGAETKEEIVLQGRAFILPDNISGSVYLDVKKMIYDTHTFENLKGNMTINKRIMYFPKVAVRTGGADVFGSLTIQERTPEIFYISSQVVSRNINFKKLFKEWENFKQDAIKSENIEGNAQANVQFEALFDLRSGIISNSIIARAGIQIDNGRLKNVGAFNTIVSSLRTSSAKHILKKGEIDAFAHDLQDLKFKQLKNTILIKDGIVELPSMSIESSALNIEMSGKHTFKNIVDYKFGFYFRDLKSEKVTEFGVEVDDGLGMNVFMLMYGDFYNPTIKWDFDSWKANIKKYNEQEKKDLKSMLKTEFGVFKNDTSVKTYIKTNQPHEELIIEFDPVNGIDTVIENKQPEKDKKMPKFLKKWKQEAEKEDDLEFEFDDQ